MKVANLSFEDQVIMLDLHEYENCTFTRCRMTYLGFGGVVFNNCTFNECSWAFSGHAANTINFMTLMYQQGGEDGQKLIEQTMENIRGGRHPSGE